MRRLVLAAGLACSLGCASLRDPVPPGFERIALQSEVARDPQGQLEGDLDAHSTLMGSLIGVAVGAPIGALLGFGAGTGLSFVDCYDGDDWEDLGDAFSCGPAWMFGGLFAGAALGAATGAGIGGYDGLPAETADAVTSRLYRLGQDPSLDAQLGDAVRQVIPAAKQVDPANAEATVIARLDRLDLHQHLRDRLSIRLDASMVQSWQGPDGAPKRNTCAYHYTTGRRDAEAWLANDGAAFQQAVEEGIWTIARWMARDLAAFAERKELAKTASEPASCLREGPG